MAGSLLPLLAVLLSAWPAVGDPEGPAHVDGAPPSKIGKESSVFKHHSQWLNLANVSIQSVTG